MERKIGVIRDSVNGMEKYCRIPIQRRRTPICDAEIAELEKLQDRFHMDTELLGRVGCLLSDLGFPYFAGKIFTYIDMGQEKECMQFIEPMMLQTESEAKNE